MYCASPLVYVPETVYLNKVSCVEYGSRRTKLCFHFTKDQSKRHLGELTVALGREESMEMSAVHFLMLLLAWWH